MIKSPKQNWIDEYKDNSAIKEVVWKSSHLGEGWVAISKTTNNFKKFKNRIESTINPKSVKVHKNMMTDQLIQYAHQNEEYRTYKIRNQVEDFVVMTSDDWHIHLYPYNDGVMLYTINVNEDKRGNSIGTNLLNQLYTISEDLNIPIYLIPYPDYLFLDKVDKEKELIDRLKNYYSRMDFGPVTENSLVWSNFE